MLVNKYEENIEIGCKRVKNVLIKYACFGTFADDFTMKARAADAAKMSPWENFASELNFANFSMSGNSFDSSDSPSVKYQNGYSFMNL